MFIKTILIHSSNVGFTYKKDLWKHISIGIKPEILVTWNGGRPYTFSEFRSIGNICWRRVICKTFIFSCHYLARDGSQFYILKEILLVVNTIMAACFVSLMFTKSSFWFCKTAFSFNVLTVQRNIATEITMQNNTRN